MARKKVSLGKVRKILSSLKMKHQKIGSLVFFCSFHGKILDLGKVNECKTRKCEYLTKVPRTCYDLRFYPETEECEKSVLELRENNARKG